MSSSDFSPILNPAGTPVAGGLYLLQLNNASSDSTECFPLHLLVNDMNYKYEQNSGLSPKNNPENMQRQLPLKKCVDSYEIIEPLDYCVYKQDNQVTTSTLLENESLNKNTIPYNGLAVPDKAFVTSKSRDKYNCSSVKKEIQSYQIKHKNEMEDMSQKIKNYVHIADRVVPPRAVAVLPTALQLRRGCISPRRSLPARIRFGPLQGEISKITITEADVLIREAATSNTPVFLMARKEESVLHIDVTNEDRSNWLSLLPLGDQTTANVWLYEEDCEIYAMTAKSIASRTPLALGYSKKYVDIHQLPSGPVFDLHEAMPEGSKQWSCSICQHRMTSSALLQRHKDIYHKGDKPSPRRRYRCSQCARTFSRLFTLKRHMLGFCTKKSEKSYNPVNTPPIEEKRDVLYTPPNVDDNRMPSDESLQNYTNGLDFSTNLFDTDRMPNLDISGSSRSETEFNPYAVGFKEENCFESDVRFSNSSVEIGHKNASKNDEKVLVACPHCDDIVVKEKKRLHLRDCRARHFECECGQVFNKKDSLAQHIHAEHSMELKSNVLKDKVTATPYKCEKCKHMFKRRGMLVNHLWRVHNVSASVPLERRVRHYPCVACPKIYRAAAKRDRHVRNHHPGSELIRAPPIEGETRACEPAACAACPRQYATRAKMLQHMRAHHPQLAESMKKTKNDKTAFKGNV